MTSFLRWCRRLGGTASLALIFDTVAARAAYADPATEPLGLVIFGDDLPREDVRTGLERELGRSVALLPSSAAHGTAYLTVTWRKERSELAVSYDERGRGTVSRIVAARPSAEQNVKDAILLATSLVRNDAEELLGKPAPTPTAANVTPNADVRSSPGPAPSGNPAPRPDFVPVHASLVHPLATNFDRPWATTRFSLNLIYGRAGELDGGVQLGLANAIVGESGRATGDMSGVQLAPLVGLNYASGRAGGVQFGGLVNVAGGGLAGVQIGTGANVAARASGGVQISPVNVAGDLQGVQIGIVNVGKKTSGVTVGLVNVADDVDGLPIGIVNVTRTGGVHPVAWGGTATFLNAGVKFSTRYTYTMIAAHYTVVRAEYGPTASFYVGERPFLGGGFFVGGHCPIGSAAIEFDAGFSAMGATEQSVVPMNGGGNLYNEILLEPRFRVLGAYAFASHLGVFAGGAAVTRLRIVNDGADTLVHVFPEAVGGLQF
jgi:hypothetical protein